MTDALIYGAAAIAILLLVRRLHRKHTQAVRDRAALERVRNMELPPLREGERRYFASGSVNPLRDTECRWTP